MHHNKFSATTNASSDNLNSGHPNGNQDDPQQHPPHCALSREASLKKGSDGKKIPLLKALTLIHLIRHYSTL